jgi:hypothetical protein
MRKALIITIVVAAAASCADVLSIDDIVIGDGGAKSSSGGSGGGTTSQGGSMGGESSSPTTGGGGPGGASAESCDNGLDDNGDDLIDCEDPLCSAYTCAPEVPSGWTGPYSAHIAATASSCPAAAPTEIFTGFEGNLDAQNPTCSVCSCGPPNATCSFPNVRFYNLSGCGDLQGIENASVLNGCDSIVGPGTDSDSVRGRDTSSPQGGVGGCTPTGVVATLPPATFDNEMRLCASPMLGAGCGTGSRCIPTPEAPFSDKPCIMKSGDEDCPMSGYVDKQLVYAGYTEGRVCTMCTCGSAEGVECNATTTVYEDLGCVGQSHVVPHDESCVTTNESVLSMSLDIQVAGGCAEQGGQPDGVATPTGERTVCCVP